MIIDTSKIHPASILIKIKIKTKRRKHKYNRKTIRKLKKKIFKYLKN
jgi:hypothetical protein